ncbi:unnamed protein product [Sphenostylis stenocarpa]|uniref:Uncharacterized protein n=1 Tax=Sphenostylis stenocarpa TaxID=92480 RepID=A0AA86SXI3_9FABA|nr:unnamed protein product [Sphenostylis stenocarpa]
MYPLVCVVDAVAKNHRSDAVCFVGGWIIREEHLVEDLDHGRDLLQAVVLKHNIRTMDESKLRQWLE